MFFWIFAVYIVAVALGAAFVITFIKARRLAAYTERMKCTDAMTGLLNRDGFLSAGAEFLKKTHNDGNGAALLVLDIDALGKINTLFGTEVGDSVINGFADSVKLASGNCFICGRVNTDDFAVLMCYGNEIEIEAFISEFDHTLQKRFAGTAVMECLNYFTGVALYDGQDDIYTLYNKANLGIIMKESSRVTYFNKDMENRMVENELMRTEILTALEEGQFELYYQPKIDFNSGDIIGMEALIRWHHPVKGFVSPDEFIPLAEQTGIITRIDEWGLRTACRQCKEWQDKGLPPVKVSVNMSQAQFYRTDVLTTINNVLAETSLDPKWLEIEVTETMAMQDIERTVNVLDRIRKMGVSISMDDFGSGYSSLSSLKTIPLDTLKIDRSLVCDLDDNQVSQQITSAIVELGKAMRLIILAEGVETTEQIRFLKKVGCDLAQGYYYSKPRPADEITAILLMPKELRKASKK